ncbi:MAG TPA: hypothetical protein VNK04_25700 [Gemmataceae bacterium]|nr:hypothetical protein [Gemmataceae bacterium]
MNPRERVLALVLLATVILAGGGFAVYQFLWSPLRNQDWALAELEKKIAAKQAQIKDLEVRKRQIERWRALSLPGDPHFALAAYQKHLDQLVAESDFAPGAITIKHRELEVAGAAAARAKKQPFTKLSFDVSGHGNMASLAKFLEKFYRTPLLHQVRSIDIRRPDTARPGQRPEDLDIKLQIEALIVEGAPKRDTLLPPEEKRADMQLPLAEKPRRYDVLAARNIFLPPPPPVDRIVPDVTRFVRLTEITQNENRVQASLYDVYNNELSRLAVATGYDTFRIIDDNKNEVVRGKVVRIEDRDLIFRVDDRFYRIHLNQTIYEAMRRPLSEEEVKELKLTASVP